MIGDTHADPPRSRNVKLTDAEWSALERIARENHLTWAGIPSRSEAVRLLIRRESGVEARARHRG